MTKIRVKPESNVQSQSKIDLKRRKTLRFTPDRLAFNFSFITRDHKYNFEDKSFSKLAKVKVFDKLLRLSVERYHAVLGWPKRLGLENIPEKEVALALHPEFTKSLRYQDCLPGFWVFRISDTGRVIGKIQETTFYVLAVDTKFKLYKH